MTALDHIRASLAHYAEERTNALAEADTATEALRAAVRSAHRHGMPKTEIARLAGISRVTLDAWLEGK